MEITITLDIVRRLRFDINALADADHLLRTDIAEVAKGRPRISDIRILLWAGLKWEDRRLTLERVGELMAAELKRPGGLQLNEMWRLIDEAIGEAAPFGPSGNEQAEAAPAPPPSANGSSRPSGSATASSDSAPPSSNG